MGSIPLILRHAKCLSSIGNLTYGTPNRPIIENPFQCFNSQGLRIMLGNQIAKCPSPNPMQRVVTSFNCILVGKLIIFFCLYSWEKKKKTLLIFKLEDFFSPFLANNQKEENLWFYFLNNTNILTFGFCDFYWPCLPRQGYRV